MWHAGSATVTDAASASGAPTGEPSTAASRGSRSSTPTTAAPSTAISRIRRFRVRLTDWDDVSTFGVISASSAGALERVGDRLRVAVRGRGRDQLRSRSTARRRSAVPAGSSIPVPTVDMAVGASGDSVRQLQTLLNHFGASLTVDGSSATRPRSAVIGFQNTSGLTADGEWHVEEWNAAQSRLASEGGIPWTLLTPSPVAGPIVFSTPVDAVNAASGAVLGACEVVGIDHPLPRHARTARRLRTEPRRQPARRRALSARRRAPRGVGELGIGRRRRRHERPARARPSRPGRTRSRSRATRTPRRATRPRARCTAGRRRGRRPTSAGFITGEQVLSNQAVADTGTVVRMRDGVLVSTEFSASNGPRTAGGSYPAVDDPWDDVPGNPLHTWTRIIDADALATKYGLPNGNGIATVHDNGSTFDGIWANKVVRNGALLATAWDFRNAFGLPSPGFELIPITRERGHVGTAVVHRRLGRRQRRRQRRVRAARAARRRVRFGDMGQHRLATHPGRLDPGRRVGCQRRARSEPSWPSSSSATTTRSGRWRRASTP